MNLNPKETFRKNGFDFKLIKSEEVFAIYELSYLGDVRGYEVHKLRKIPSLASFNDKIINDYIKYPSNEDFGKYGWGYSFLKDAEDKLQELKKGLNQNG